MKYGLWLALGLACAGFGWGADASAQTASAAAKTRVGVYDSRALAYAHFWSPANQQKIGALVKTAKEAKDKGNTERYEEIKAAMKATQDRNHLQVFSTAPVDNVLNEMRDRVEATKKEAGVSQLISKWDTQELKGIPRTQQVDVTDMLLREFKLAEKQIKVLEDMRKKDPLPLDQAKELLRQGKL